MSNVISPAVNLIWPPMLTLFPVSSALFPVKTGICQSACLHDAFQKSNLIEFINISFFYTYTIYICLIYQCLIQIISFFKNEMHFLLLLYFVQN